MRVKITVHYDGSAYRGWQAQPGQPTVQGTLEDALHELTRRRMRVFGAGRTDTGVHATGQVAAFDAPEGWTSKRLRRALNGVLPRSIWISAAEDAAETFDPRRDALRRCYCYFIGTRPVCRSPHLESRCWPLRRAPEERLLDACAAQLGGVGDFSAFAKAGQPWRGTECEIYEATWTPWMGGELAGDPGPPAGAIFRISGNRFLHRMVRYLTGTMVEIGIGKRNLGDFARLLEAAPGAICSPPAPAKGLFLVGVEY